jgi:hypothetical protein
VFKCSGTWYIFWETLQWVIERRVKGCVFFVILHHWVSLDVHYYKYRPVDRANQHYNYCTTYTHDLFVLIFCWTLNIWKKFPYTRKNLYEIYIWCCTPRVKWPEHEAATHLHQVQRLRMCRALFPFPVCPHGVMWSTGRTFMLSLIWVLYDEVGILDWYRP